jgi:hypothetical protein
MNFNFDECQISSDVAIRRKQSRQEKIRQTWLKFFEGDLNTKYVYSVQVYLNIIMLKLLHTKEKRKHFSK